MTNAKTKKSASNKMRVFKYICMVFLIGFCSCQNSKIRTQQKAEIESGFQQAYQLESKGPLSLESKNIFSYDEKHFSICDNVTDQKELLLFVVHEEQLILEMWFKDREVWRHEAIVYPKQPNYEDIVSLRLKGISQLAKLKFTLDEEEGHVTFEAVEFLTDGLKSKTCPIKIDESTLVYCETEMVSSLIKMDLGTLKSEVLVHHAFAPQWLPEEQKIIYINDEVPQRDFYVVDLDETTTKKATNKQLRAAMNHSSRHPLSSLYALKLMDSEPNQSIVEFTNLTKMLETASQKSPKIKVARYQLESALYKFMQSSHNLKIDLNIGSTYAIDRNILTSSQDRAAGDATTLTDFSRMLASLNYTLIPNLRYREAWSDSQVWIYKDAVQDYYLELNQVLLETLQHVHEINVVEQKHFYLNLILKLCRETMTTLKEVDHFNVQVNDLMGYFTDIELIHQKELKLTEATFLREQSMLRLKLGLRAEETLRFPLGLDLQVSEELFEAKLLNERATLNNPMLRKAFLSLLRAAAERDMGHPDFRGDYLSLSLSYGMGVHHWDKLIDDFLGFSTSMSVPLFRKPKPLLHDLEWKSMVEARRFEIERMLDENKIIINEWVNKIDLFRNLEKGFLKSNLNYLNNARSRYAISQMGLSSSIAGKPVKQLEIEYLKGKLQECNAFKNKIDVELALLKSVHDVQTTFEWSNPLQSDFKDLSYFFDASGALELKDAKQVLASLPRDKRVFVILRVSELKTYELEIDYLFKLILEQGTILIPLLEINEDYEEVCDYLRHSNVLMRYAIYNVCFVLDHNRLSIKKIKAMLDYVLPFQKAHLIYKQALNDDVIEKLSQLNVSISEVDAVYQTTFKNLFKVKLQQHCYAPHDFVQVK